MKQISTLCLSSRSIVTDLLTLKVPKDYVILCADVENLYPIEYGSHAIYEMLQNIKLYHEEGIQLIVQILSWVLTNNYFEFNNQVYISSNLWHRYGDYNCSYNSNLTLAYLEDKFMDSYSLEIVY